MKARLLSYFLIICLVSTCAWSQKFAPQFGAGFSSSISVPFTRTCHTVELEQNLQTKYPNRFNEQQFEEIIQTLSNQKERSRSVADEVYYIPTIVHVVHNGEAIGNGSNISYDQVMSQFDVLNEDFRRVGNGSNDDPIGADAYIEFYPVLQNPDGTPLSEEGINRVDGEKAFWGEVDIETNLKPNTVWDTDRFFNIWVVPFGGDLDGVLGYAQFPSLSGLPGLGNDEGPAQTDGIVIGYQFFGNTGNVSAPFDQGRTATHEVGHWLGLRHIWGDGGCSVDDYCADTPPAAEPNVGCPDSDTCPQDDLMDMVENYMDYTDDACMNIFTQDQKDRMRIVLENSIRRQSLIRAQCSDAEVVATGSNTTDTRGWYTYTASAQSIVTFSSIDETDQNTLLRVYSACNTAPIISSDDAFGTDQSEVSVAIASDETLYIYWSLIGAEGTFNWTLVESEQVTAGACSLAETAASGTNNVPATNLNEYWYEYEQTAADSKLTISSPNSYQIFGGSCDELKLLASGSAEIVLTEVAQSETVFIQFDADGGGFEWSLTSEQLSEGEGCSTAEVAVEGSNNATFSSHWYTFTMPQFGYLSLSSVGQSANTNVTVYADCDHNLLAENEDDGNGQSDLTITLDEGDEVKILWENLSSDAAFAWELLIADIPAGEQCLNPEVISTGDATIDTEFDVFWTSYTVQNSNTKLVIETNDDVDIYVISDCDATEVYGSGTQSIQATGMSQGQEVKVVWDLSYLIESGPVNYTLSEEEIEVGDLCSMPMEASLGVNEASNVPMWFSYTLQTDEAVKISSVGYTEADTYLFVFSDCDEGPLAESDDSGDGYQSELLISDLGAGETLYIFWDNAYSSESFEWELSTVSIDQGEICGDPLAAIVGENTVEVSDTDMTWFSYTMSDADNKLILSSNSSEYFGVVSDCDFGEIYGSGQSSVTVVGLENDQEVYLVFETLLGESYSFTLEEESLEEGDVCTTALSVAPGVHVAPQAPYWYTYTMPKAGDLKVSSRNRTETDTYLLILSGCDGQVLAEHDDIDYENEVYQSEILLEGLEAGEEVIIHWSSEWSSEAFSWELSVDGVSNEAPVVSDETFEVSVTEGVVEIGQVNATDPDGDQLYYEITSGNDLNIFSVDESGTLFADMSMWPITQMSVQLEVKVTDLIATVSTTITIELLVLGVDDHQEDVFPNPTDGLVYFKFRNGFNSGQVLDLSGRSVMRFDSMQIDMSCLPDGIYFIRVNLEEETKSFRVVLNKD